MTALIAALNAATIVLVIFTILAARASAWYSTQATLWLTDYDEARRREADPPFSVRTYQRITRRTRQKKDR